MSETHLRKILDDVLVWGVLSERHGYDFNGHVLSAPGARLCIDPVEPSDAIAEELVRLGIDRILLTNRNHVRAANRLRALTGARVAIHPADAEYARGQGAEIDEELHPGSRIDQLVTLSVPGKSPGEVAFHWPERGILLVGDAVIGNPPGRCSLLPERVISDLPRLRSSVEALLAVDFDILLMGDGHSILHGAHQRLDELVATFPRATA